jgi:hypothetical protein
VRLWADHLGLAPAAVHNPLVAAPSWTVKTGDTTPYNVDGGVDTARLPSSSDTAWDDLWDPDGS